MKMEKIEDLGYNDDFESERQSLGLGDFAVARVVAEHKGLYKVKDCNWEYFAKITGKRIFDAKGREDFPAVGDWVAITTLDNEKAVIKAILPRKTILRRKDNNKEEAQLIATNIDVAFIVESMDRDYNLNRFERYIVLATEGGVKPVILLNKIDLISCEDLFSKIKEIIDRFEGIDILTASIINENYLDELTAYIEKGKTYCFLGSSGVGKSSLINKLLQKEEIRTKQISESTGRGKHTTTSREMYFMKNGGILIDNPGTREVGITDSEIGLKTVFEDVKAFSTGCKFRDCTHTNEPGCAVLKAIEQDELDEQKYENFTKLKKESDFYQMSNFEKRKKDRSFGKFIKKSLDQLKKYE
jgi:ribosome biogenesis GTPase